MIHSPTMLTIVNESRLQVGGENGDDNEKVKSMSATGFWCKLEVAMAAKCGFSLCVFLECPRCLHAILYYI
jgi:hypothetical protein